MKKRRFSKSSSPRPIDPLDLFNRLTLRGRIENIWDTQADALRQWHPEQRTSNDIVVQMNTGGGKTLVGLLMAQSLVNETRGRVLYVCANNQLIEQTESRATDIGLVPATRYKQAWKHQEAFAAGDTFCLTNYATVFNGHSTIAKDAPIDAVIFDDAHVAESLIRNCFTLTVPIKHDAYSRIMHILQKHFARSPQASQFDDALKGAFTQVVYVPMFEVWSHANAIRRLLIDAGVADDDRMTYPWQHLRNKLSACCILLNGRAIEIAPPVLPLASLPYFSQTCRRVYLTATLPSRASFIRSFGVAEPTLIEPSGKSGEAQRLFVFVPGESDEEQRDAACELVAAHKACVISPSKHKASQWVPPAELFDEDTSDAELDRFRMAKGPRLLAFIARYDGFDLPGKACRLLILDRLPRGESLLELFLDEGVQVETIRISYTATRIVQAIGRIFRSNTDHGVVLLTGTDLQTWLRTPKWRAYLPHLLQQQLQFALDLERLVTDEEETWEGLISAILDGDREWDATYTDSIDHYEVLSSKRDADWYVELLPAEQAAYQSLWAGQYRHAAVQYEQLVERAMRCEPRLAAWYRHWYAHCLLCADDRGRSLAEFVAASNIRSELGRPTEKLSGAFAPPAARDVTDQAAKIRERYEKRRAKLLATLESIGKRLVYGDDTAPAEEAVRELGEALGLDATRPDDKSRGLGPDVLWCGFNDLPPRGFELKTNKRTGTVYQKKEDIGQCHDHEQWMRTHYGDGSHLSIVGRYLPVSGKANPSATLRVVPVEALQGLLERTKQMFDAIESAPAGDLTGEIQKWLNFYGLDWPTCVDGLESRLAIDLRGDA